MQEAAVTRRPGTVVRRQAILDAALQLFATRGLRATAVEDICRASGASNGSLYHHFGSKEGVAAALYAGAVEDYQHEALAVLESATTAEAGFRGCVAHYLEWVLEHPDLARLMLAVEHSDVRALAAERLAVLNETFRAGIAAWMGRRRTAGDLPDVPMDVLVPAMLGAARRFAEQWLAGRTQTPMDEAAPVLADLAWRGLGGRPTAPAR